MMVKQSDEKVKHTYCALQLSSVLVVPSRLTRREYCGTTPEHATSCPQDR